MKNINKLNHLQYALIYSLITFIFSISCTHLPKKSENIEITWPSFRGHPYNLGLSAFNVEPSLIMDWLLPIQPTVIRSTPAATRTHLENQWRHRSIGISFSNLRLNDCISSH